jgi:putative oxidoreductase
MKIIRQMIMNDIIKQLLYSDLGSSLSNRAILAFRILLSIDLFRSHGMKKLRRNNNVNPEELPNPPSIPQCLNNLKATISDTAVPVLVKLGAFTRLAVLPTIDITAVGYFVVHKNAPLEVGMFPICTPFPFSYCLQQGRAAYRLTTIFLIIFFNF